MFFIMGVGQDSKQLPFDQTIVCKCCQKYGHLHIFVSYSYFSFFFLPLFKWNKRYYAKMSCCNASCEISPELGREIERGNLTYINEDFLPFTASYHSWKSCRNCGFSTSEDFEYCPKCGNRF